MKKLIALSLAALMILPVLAGCHGSSGRAVFEVPKEFDETRIYEISFWSKNDNNQTQREIYKKAIEDFEKIYPNIKVNLKPYTDYGSIYNDVITNIATNTTPNVCITYPDHIATYMQGNNVVVNLDGIISDSTYGLGGTKIRFDAPSKDEIVEKFLSECYLNGSCYAVPFMRSTEACYISKQLVEKLGYEIPDILTWDFVWEVSDKAMEKDSDGNYLVNGQKVLIPFIYKSTDNMMISMLKQKNAGYSTNNGEIQIFNDTTKEILLGISEHAVKKDGDRNGAFSTFKISSYPGNFLNAGQCIFAIDSTAGATWMGSGAPNLDIHKSDIVEFDTIVRPIPQYDTSNPQMISQGPSVCIFNKEDPQEVLASWIFVQFLLTNNVQLSYSGTEGYLPVTRKALDSDEFADYLSRSGQDDEHYQVVIDAKRLLMDNIDNTFVTPVFNGSTSLRDAAGQLIEEVTKEMRRNKKYIARGSVDDEYLTDLFSKITALFRLDQIETGSGSGKADLGPMPGASVALLAVLASAWVIIGTYALIRQIKEKKKSSDVH